MSIGGVVYPDFWDNDVRDSYIRLPLQDNDLKTNIINLCKITIPNISIKNIRNCSKQEQLQFLHDT